jgi:hypothetical protein
VIGVRALCARGSGTVAHNGQLALQHAEALMQCRVQVLTHDAGAGKRGQLGDTAALTVLPGQLEDHRALAGDRVLPNLAGFDGSTVSRRRSIRMRHAPSLNRGPRHGQPPAGNLAWSAAAFAWEEWSASATWALLPLPQRDSARRASVPPARLSRLVRGCTAPPIRASLP